MTEEIYSSMQDLANEDKRYPVEAYFFVQSALAYAADTMKLGTCYDAELQLTPEELHQAQREQHLTGQQLSEAIRSYALNQFGYLSKVVLAYWGIHQTSCFGDIVYNMIEAGFMKKSSHDERSHFNDVYDFEDAFENDFEIRCRPIASR